ncbi:hypothetical protein OIU77_021368 [Salix suchowensis]|uniref:Uncharacterized protein n=1 Tax=Salix suchowensis TaxID=1278906 RepID=A0ABQ9C9J2_9ROSI|nr:hypothetical protein OIU77_021368 [Salix suchowensis]
MMGRGVAKQGWRKGPWTPEEDKLLSAYVSENGEGRWSSVSRFSGLNRSGKSCRLRWVNYLRPGLKRSQITPQEEGIIIELHALWGNKQKDKSSQKQDQRKAQILKPEMQQHQQQLESGDMKMENTIDDHFKMNEAEMFHNLEDQCWSAMSQDAASWADFVVEDCYGLWGGLWNLDDHPQG